VVKCDICGAPATCGQCDVVETAPVKDAKGVIWATFRHYGKWRYGCMKHQPARSRVYRLGDKDYPDGLAGSDR
jgi:hypothetical protein